AALAPTEVPQSVIQAPRDPATERAGFYGLGLAVSYTDFGTIQWNHSGAFATAGAATAVYLLPEAGVGVRALTHGVPGGGPEAFCLGELDLAQRGEVASDYIGAMAPAFAAVMAETLGPTDWTTPPPAARPALPDTAYVGTYRNDYYGKVAVA